MFGLEVGIFILIVDGHRRLPLDAGGAAGAGAVLQPAREGVRRGRARAGRQHPRQVVRHILPNSLGPVIVAGTIDVAAAIIAESTLSFLGLGFPPDIPTWGRILYDGRDYMDIACTGRCSRAWPSSSPC
jgi:peptide/nickel transport system permease protein